MLDCKEGRVNFKCFRFCVIFIQNFLVVLRLFYMPNEMYESGVGYGL